MKKIPSPGNRFSLFALVLAFVGLGSSATATLVTYPAPSGAVLNTTFSVQVREPGGAWHPLDEYNTTVGRSTGIATSFAYFDCSGAVDVSVTWSGGTISSARVRPLANGITPAISGNTLTFSLSGPKKVVVEVNGDIYRCLHLFANPLEVNPPSPTDPNVIYLGPGLYTGNRTVGSGKTLYLAGGAVLRGAVVMSNATNVKLLGRGVIDRPSGWAIQTASSNGVTIDGIICAGAGDGNNGGYTVVGGQTSNLSINNLKSFSFKRWSDGIDLCACFNVTINDVFMRNGDDCIAVYASRLSGGPGVYRGNTSTVTVTNSILWADVAHPINIGTHGDASGTGNTISGLTFRNIDVLEQNEPQVDYQGTMALSVGDKNLVTNVRFESIRVEDFTLGALLNFKVMYNTAYNQAPGRGIDGVYLKDISYTGANTNASPIVGYDATRLTKNITFENLRINGQLILSATAGKISIGSFTQNIQFIAAAAGFPAAGTYKLKSRASGLVLDNMGRTTNGSDVAQSTSSTSNNQKWVLSYLSSNVVKLQCVTGGLFLDGMGRTTDGAHVGEWASSGSTNQQWTIVDAGGGYYKLKNVATGKCVDIGTSPWANGDAVEQWSDSTNQNQHWQFVAP